MAYENQALVELRDLKKYFDIKGKGKLHAVDGINLKIMPGETLGLVGESGCGKSTVGNVIMRLHKATSGEVLFRGKNILDARGKESLEYKKKMQMIFQDPYSSLNPHKTIYQILSEAYDIHHMASGAERKRQIDELIDHVGIEPFLLDQFPHELDGGRRQLVGIARALSLNPEFIVCDEPVSALDVSIQASIINLLMDLQKKMSLSYLFVSHDLSVVRHISNRIAVMYLGQVMEIADTETMFSNTMHPYSIALLSAIPKMDFSKSKRIVLKGDVPSPINPPSGCRFAGRCWMAQECCKTQCPSLTEVEDGHFVACHFAKESKDRLADYMKQEHSAADVISEATAEA